MSDIINGQMECESQNQINSSGPLVFREQDRISDEAKELFKKLNIHFSQEDKDTPKNLGLSEDWASYYIGASWLTKEKAVVVIPKKIGTNNSKETDFIQLFLCALKFAPSAEYFSNYYGINFEQPQIATDSFSEQLTPLLIVHFLCTLKNVVSKGLKKDYVIREENLKAKVRGRIMMQKNLQKNIFPQRMDRVYCKFQEYTVDIPENRLLKKALIFSENYLSKLVSIDYHESLGELKRQINQMKSNFSLVSDEIEVYEIKALRKNKLFRDYSEAIKLAKMILQRFDYSISKSGSIQKTVPPFWIDMSRLFEIYVYSKLYEAYGNTVQFQVPGRLKTVVDFIKTDEKLILDAKYKTRYQKHNSPLLADIREISGYARDDKILKKLGIYKTSFEKDENMVRCVIIYPEYMKIEIEDNMDDVEKKEIESFNNKENKNEIFFNRPILELIKGQDIPGFRKFYKISVSLPIR